MKYTEIGKLGQGGFGEVFHVKDANGRDMALKKFALHPSMDSIKDLARKRFIKEAIYQKELDHPNIVEIYAVDQSATPPFYTMPLADASMQKDITDGVLNKSNFIKCIYDIMAGLEEMHFYNMYHRDLKPANVLRFTEKYAICDFGLMSLNKTGITTLTTTGMAKTSDLYTAPEITQDLKHASVRSDIYSLGCIVHDFVGQTTRVPCNEISESSTYGDLLRGATRKDPLRRFKSVASFREALVSIFQTKQDAKTEAAEAILELMREDIDNFNSDEIAKLSDFLSSSKSKDEKDIVLNELSLDIIDKIISDGRHATFIATSFFDYVRDGSFQWEYCDTLSNRIQRFMEIGSVDLISEGTFALLYMGTNHNRWYVEEKAASYFKGNIDEKLLKRLIMEIRVDGNKFCRAMDHLMHSIRHSLNMFHPSIQEIYSTVCGK